MINDTCYGLTWKCSSWACLLNTLSSADDATWGCSRNSARWNAAGGSRSLMWCECEVLNSMPLAGGAVSELKECVIGGGLAYPHFLLKLPDCGNNVTLQPRLLLSYLPLQNGMNPLGVIQNKLFLPEIVRQVFYHSNQASNQYCHCGLALWVSCLCPPAVFCCFLDIMR